MYPMTNLEMFFPMKVFLLICTHMASTSKFSLVARVATLGNSGNLHKSKMAVKRHLENTALEVFILE